MNTLKFRWLAFVIGTLTTLGIPVSAIWIHYQTLSHGEVVKVRLMPIDPYDPFRGRYVALQLENERVPAAAPESFADQRHRSGYLSYRTDEDGFLQAIEIYENRPTETPYLEVYDIWEIGENEYTYQLPFDRYYLNEKDAQLAEDIARESLRVQQIAAESEKLPSYLILRVRRGNAAIENLMIDELPVQQRIREERKKQGQ